MTFILVCLIIALVLVALRALHVVEVPVDLGWLGLAFLAVALALAASGVSLVLYVVAAVLLAVEAFGALPTTRPHFGWLSVALLVLAKVLA